MSYFESRYICSGICNTGLFYYSLDLSYGVPTNNCLIYMKNAIGNNMFYLGITALVTGGTMLLIWICQYCLWRKFEDQGEFDNRN